MTISKKSTIFVQSSWKLVKIIISWGNHFHKVSWGLEKNCGFFINGQFLNMWYLFLLRPYFSIFFNIINFSYPFILMLGGCLKDALPGKHARSVQTWFHLEINLWFINAMLRAYYYQQCWSINTCRCRAQPTLLYSLAPNTMCQT